ncbi:MAG: type II toxin-antitoxin system RelE/ParE family toxin [Gammaproteobacteria bacterium]
MKESVERPSTCRSRGCARKFRPKSQGWESRATCDDLADLGNTSQEPLFGLGFWLGYEYGILTFGLRQANKYYDGIVVRFRAIAEQPELYAAVDHVRPGYGRMSTGACSR